MRDVFLMISSLGNIGYDIFRSGLLELATIDVESRDRLLRHSSVRELDNYCMLFSNYSQDEQNIIQFIEQMSPSDQLIEDEQSAYSYCGSAINGFIGVDFTDKPITSIKQIVNEVSYLKWSYHFSSTEEKLRWTLVNSIYSESFQREFEKLGENVQLSIVNKFSEARSRNFASPLYPDTKIIADVTQSNFRFHVRELRVYTPVALRVYFHETPSTVFVGSVELKSNPNQTEDIKKAYERLKGLGIK